MAHPVQIGIFNIARTVVDREYAIKWLSHIGADKFVLDSENKTSAEILTELAGRRCYMSFQPGLNPNVTKIRTDIAEYIDNILKSGHGSVLEHSTYTFAIEGVSRVFTGEMNRHRAGMAISEGSMRYIRFEDMGYWIPPSIQGPDKVASWEPNGLHDIGNEGYDNYVYEVKKFKTRDVFKRAFLEAEKNYAELLDIWKDELAPESKFSKKKEITSMMRRIVPMGIATGGIWTGNLRALRHIFTMRVTPHAEEEICHVFTRILRDMATMEPNIFGDFQEVEGGFYVPKYVKV